MLAGTVNSAWVLGLVPVNQTRAHPWGAFPRLFDREPLLLEPELLDVDPELPFEPELPFPDPVRPILQS